MMKLQQQLFEIGQCPVCFGSGAVIILEARKSRTLVFYCPSCGVAWPSPPGRRIDTIFTLEEVAPQGVSLPSEEGLDSLRRQGLGLKLADVELWMPYVKEILHQDD